MNARIWIPLVIAGILIIFAILLSGTNRAQAPITPGTDIATTTTSSATTTTTTTTTTASGGGFAPFTSGIRGAVLLAPTCPVETSPVTAQCAPRPYAATVTVRRSGSASVFAEVSTSPDGSFEFSLPPGEYTIEAKGGKLLPRCVVTPFTVGPSSYVSTTLTCDTGIR